MTDDTTSIEVTKAQTTELKDLAEYPRESYKSIIARLIEDYNSDGQEAIDSHSEGAPTTDADAIAAAFVEEFPYHDMAEQTAERTAEKLEGRR